MQKKDEIRKKVYNGGMTKTSLPPMKTLKWRARIVMAERGVRSVSELARKLETVGVKVSVAQLGRLIDGKSDLLNKEVIEAMMTVLDCELSDLLRTSL